MIEALIQPVGRLLRQTAHAEVLPRFQRLTPGQIHEKAPGELVTVADRAAEKVITAGLLDLLPDSSVIGEEAVAEDPDLLDRRGDAGAVWVVDPLDGTANFAAGRAPYVMMVALLRDGVTQAGWIFDPLADSLAWARLGVGAYLEDRPLRIPVKAHPRRQDVRGVVPARFMPEPLAGRVRSRSAGLGSVLPGHHCAGREYLDLLSGTQDFALFWRTLPWDHAAGALLLAEAGGVVRRLDRDPYAPTDGLERRGLLAATSEAAWHEVRATLFPDGAGH